MLGLAFGLGSGKIYSYDNVVMMDSLVEYLSNLDVSETQWGIWVNPDNPTEEFRLGQFCFENGGYLDNWVCIGDLERLSCLPPVYEVLEYVLDNLPPYKGRRIKVNRDGMVEAYFRDRLDPEFRAFIDEEINTVRQEWARNVAEVKVEEILDRIRDCTPQGE